MVHSFHPFFSLQLTSTTVPKVAPGRKRKRQGRLPIPFLVRPNCWWKKSCTPGMIPHTYFPTCLKNSQVLKKSIAFYSSNLSSPCPALIFPGELKRDESVEHVRAAAAHVALQVLYSSETLYHPDFWQSQSPPKDCKLGICLKKEPTTSTHFNSNWWAEPTKKMRPKHDDTDVLSLPFNFSIISGSFQIPSFCSKLLPQTSKSAESWLAGNQQRTDCLATYSILGRRNANGGFPKAWWLKRGGIWCWNFCSFAWKWKIFQDGWGG